MPPLRFIHCADLHLDAPFQGVFAADDRIGRELAQATYAAFERVVDTAIEQRCDFMVIAGDVYDRPERSYYAERRFRTEMERLGEAGIQAYISHGNHDPALAARAVLSLPDNVHTFSHDRVERVEFRRGGEIAAAVYGRSFGRAAETANLALGFKREMGDPVAIAVLHANVGGNPDYDPYAPASLEDLRAAGMDYWALGHIHKQEVLSSDSAAAYVGSPQGLNPKETGPHGCFLVEIDASGVKLQHFETAAIGWHRADVDVVSATTIDEVRDLLMEACDSARATSGRRVVARFTLSGRSEANAELKRPGLLDGLLEDIRSEQVAALPWLWVDRIEDLTCTPLDVDEIRLGADFTSEVVRYADELLADDDALSSLRAELEKPVGTKLRGFQSSLTSTDVVTQARDLALDLLHGDRGERR